MQLIRENWIVLFLLSALGVGYYSISRNLQEQIQKAEKRLNTTPEKIILVKQKGTSPFVIYYGQTDPNEKTQKEEISQTAFLRFKKKLLREGWVCLESVGNVGEKKYILVPEKELGEKWISP